MALSGKLYVAGPCDESMIRGISKKFEKLLGQPVTLAVQHDVRLIGGFRALIDGRLYDASVAAQTERTRQYLTGEGQG